MSFVLKSSQIVGNTFFIKIKLRQILSWTIVPNTCRLGAYLRKNKRRNIKDHHLLTSKTPLFTLIFHDRWDVHL